MENKVHGVNKHINRATITMMEKYHWVAKQSHSKNRDKIMSMCERGINTPDMHTDKMSRWLGFIQGVLYADGLLNVKMERDTSRKLFHDAYQKSGIEIPDSITI